MAVEARHLNLFSRDMMMINSADAANTTANNIMYNAQSGYGLLSTEAAATAALLPMYESNFHHQKSTAPMIKPEISGLTSNYNLNIPISRKRLRECSVAVAGDGGALPPPQISFLGQDFSFQIQQQQIDADRLISLHMEKVRGELEEERRRQARRIIQVIEEGMVKRLKAKEEEIKKIGKLNWALEEKVKSLCIENQIWRDLAQTNEATANALRSNLEKVLDGGAAAVDDAQSCCGSNRPEEEDDAVTGGRRGEEERTMRMCRKCGEEESCVLLLPCRHLCLCSGCESTIYCCPICHAAKNASFHVNMSS
ncbi:Probable BOI-related E3 ubiquitin-protein ligase 3 [Linum grandiflorum]